MWPRREKVGNRMEWYSTAESPFGSDVYAPPNGGLGLNVFLRGGDDVFQTWHTGGRGVEQLSQSSPLIGVLPWVGRRNGRIRPRAGRKRVLIET